MSILITHQDISVSINNSHSDHLCSKACQIDSRAMSRSGNGPGNGLICNVTQVGHCQAFGSKQAIQVVQCGARSDTNLHLVSIDRTNALQGLYSYESAIRDSCRRKTVARPRNLDLLTPVRRLTNNLSEFIFGTRGFNRGGVSNLITRPVLPCGCHVYFLSQNERKRRVHLHIDAPWRPRVRTSNLTGAHYDHHASTTG